jgi:hypothetical protein
MDLEASILTLNILSGYTTQLANLGGNFLQSVNMLGTTAVVNPARFRNRPRNHRRFPRRVQTGRRYPQNRPRNA